MNKLTLALVALLAFGGCKKKADTSGAEAMAKMAEFKDAMCKCKDAKCAQDVSDKMTQWTQAQSNGKEPPKLSDADQKKAAQLGEDMGKCMQAAMAASTPPPPAGSDTAGSGAAGSGSAAAATTGLPKECDDYKAQVEKLKSCEKIPPKARDALIKAYNDASAGWATMPDGAKAGLDKSCKAGTEAVIVAAKEACGW
jgi:hypothetical protein